MKIFILENVVQCTGNYHAGGGLVVVAEDLTAAMGLVAENPHSRVTDREWADAVVLELRDEVAPRVFEFPDAGCC